MPIHAGPALVRKIAIAYRADVPVMLHGKHGIGKSEIIVQAAREIGIDVLVRDLSVMEPPDLVGMPELRDGRTHFCPPAALPTGGRGLLVLEELNRCPRYMQAPAMQLLTARAITDYVLPPGWLPIAAVNDGADGYQVDDLDAALLSRFAHLRVEADPVAWCEWARGQGVHAAVVDFVAASPDVFASPTSNPRSWTNAARIVTAWESDVGRDDSDLVVLLAGILDEAWAHAFVKTYRNRPRLPTAEDITDDYRTWRPKVKGWIRDGRLDVAVAAWSGLKRRLDDGVFRKTVLCDAARVANVGLFARDLPADLRTEATDWLASKGIIETEPTPSRPRRVRQ